MSIKSTLPLIPFIFSLLPLHTLGAITKHIPFDLDKPDKDNKVEHVASRFIIANMPSSELKLSENPQNKQAGNLISFGVRVISPLVNKNLHDCKITAFSAAPHTEAYRQEDLENTDQFLDSLYDGKPLSKSPDRKNALKTINESLAGPGYSNFSRAYYAEECNGNQLPFKNGHWANQIIKEHTQYWNKIIKEKNIVVRDPVKYPEQ